MRWLWRLLRLIGDVKALSRGRLSQAPGLEVGQEDPEAGGKAKGVVVMARRATRGTGTVFFSKERRRWMAQLTVGHARRRAAPRSQKPVQVFPATSRIGLPYGLFGPQGMG
ncbi:hypothetical protein [Thermus brockianus]